MEDTVNIDTTVQEKNITYPTDGKRAIKIINRLDKLAKACGIQQCRTYGKEVNALCLVRTLSEFFKGIAIYTTRHSGNPCRDDDDTIYIISMSERLP